MTFALLGSRRFYQKSLTVRFTKESLPRGFEAQLLLLSFVCLLSFVGPWNEWLNSKSLRQLKHIITAGTEEEHGKGMALACAAAVLFTSNCSSLTPWCRRDALP